VPVAEKFTASRVGNRRANIMNFVVKQGMLWQRVRELVCVGFAIRAANLDPKPTLFSNVVGKENMRTDSRKTEGALGEQ
jgi:hypothetical protein